jgi:predicted permease
VSAEIALALPLLVAAGMTALGTYRFINGPQGYDATGLLTFRTSLPEATYPTVVERARFADALQQSLAAVPGVTHAAAMNIIPSSNSGSWVNYEIEGEPARDPNSPPHAADYRLVSPSYFGAMRIPITRGRGFTSADARESLRVAIVSESFAARHWPGQDPLGKRIVISGRNPSPLTIVGTSGDITHDWFSRRNFPTILRPFEQAASQTIGFAVRTGGDAAALGPDVRAALERVDPNQALYQMYTQDNLVWERTIGPQYAAGMMALFGALALLLSVIGIYALVGYYVTQRRQEIGVRMALGAQRRDVVRLTLRQAGMMAAFGVAIGSVAAFALSRVLESAMLGIAQADHRLLGAFAVILAISALAAGYLPARRAASIDPMVAIRND